MKKQEETAPCKNYVKADAETYAKRGRADFFSTNFKIALANANTTSEYRNKYLKSVICSRELTKKDGKITGIYCGQRWCITCNRIKTATLINKYLGQIEALEDAQFITLTLKNCKGEELADRTKFMLKTWAAIQKKLSKKTQAIGFRKIEITYNQKFNDFHPHIHGIINGLDNAQFIVKEWIKLIQAAGIEISAQWQDIRPADSKSAKELMKYTTKLLPSRKKFQTWEDLIKDDIFVRKFLQSQDVIYKALHNLRTFQYFGFKQNEAETEPEELPIENDLQTQAQENLLNIPDGTYLRDGRGNWVHILYNVRIHNRNLTEDLIKLVNLIGSHYIKPIKI